MIKQLPLSKSVIEQCKKLPGQLQKVCLDSAMTRYQKHYHPKNDHHKKHVVIDAVLAGIVVLLVLSTVYLVFFYQRALLKQGIQVSLVPLSTSVRSGEAFSYQVVIENRGKNDITDAYVEFPSLSSFHLIQAQPFAYNQGRILLDKIKVGQEQVLNLTGVIVGEVDQSALLSAVLRIDKGIIGTGEVFASESVEILDSTLLVALDLPESLIANQPFDFTLAYENTSTVSSFEKVTLLPVWPPGLEVIESNPLFDGDVDYWEFENIGSLQAGTITGQARLITDSLDLSEFKVKAYVAPQGLPLLQQELVMQIPVAYPNITAELTSTNSVVNLGQSIEYRLNVENNEDFSLSNIRLQVKPNLAIFETPLGIDENGVVEIHLGSELGAGQQITESLRLNLRSTVNPKLAFGSGDVAIRLSSKVLYQAKDDQLVTYPLLPAITQINSDLTANGFARYFTVEGDQIGRGPLPPTVAETTKYWVFIHLDNQLHGLSQVNVSGSLSQGVDWTGRESVTEGLAINFNEATRFFQWNVGEIPGYQTRFNDHAFGTAFEVAINPSVADVDKVKVLVQSIEVQGIDDKTGQIITRKLPDITTHLVQDAYDGGDGKVQL
jgi:hypothetical protein